MEWEHDELLDYLMDMEDSPAGVDKCRSDFKFHKVKPKPTNFEVSIAPRKYPPLKKSTKLNNKIRKRYKQKKFNFLDLIRNGKWKANSLIPATNPTPKKPHSKFNHRPDNKPSLEKRSKTVFNVT